VEESQLSPEDISMQYEDQVKQKPRKKQTSESHDEQMTNDDTGGSDSMDKSTFDAVIYWATGLLNYC